MDELAFLLLTKIPTAPKRISTPELVAAARSAGHDVTKRAVQKRLKGFALSLALHCNESSKPYQWSWKPGEKEKLFPRMHPHEALGLALAAEHIRPLLPPRTVQWLDDRLDLTEREIEGEGTGKPKRWRDRVRRVPHELPRIAPQVERTVFAAVSEALYEGLALSLVYQKRFAVEPTHYLVHPLGLCERSGELWLCARKEDPQGPGPVRFFLLHRMREARAEKGRPALVPPGFSLDAAIRDGLAHFPLELGSGIALRARFHRDVVEKLEEMPIAKDQTLRAVDDTWFELRATVAHTRALHTFLVGYGPYCVVEEPLLLREAVADDHRRAAAQYDGAAVAGHAGSADANVEAAPTGKRAKPSADAGPAAATRT